MRDNGNMADVFNLESYLSNGVENIVRGAIKASLSNPKESIFIAKYSIYSKNSRKLRAEAEDRGEHIPPFLIASITSQCNLHCKGCYARGNHACVDREAQNQLTDQEWLKIFEEAKELGIGFVLLAGGEPFMRPDIIKEAGKIPEIIFPIFTNGTMIDDDYIKLFVKYRNLIPILSIEGNEEYTDSRRGNGVYQKLIYAMDVMKSNKILYGTSVTVTKQNLNEVTTIEFLDKLYSRGCKVVFFIEYVPISKDTEYMAFENEEREILKEKIADLRNTYEDMIFISFPGDEKTSGGCLAAGRGFFHINSHGGAEPCPFSPYSDTNLKNVSLKEAINSPLFKKLRDNNLLIEEHAGGCVLFEREEQVKQLIADGSVEI